MANYYLATWGECMFTLLPSAIRERETYFSDAVVSHFEEEQPTLSDAQQYCANRITEASNTDDIEICYVHGVTGSGKTEVFLSSMQAIIKEAKQAIYLVPEIALVMQCYPLFCARFGKDNVAVLHSSLTNSQRLTEWNKIKSQQAKVIIGVRSAVFAPVQNLGAIIIDEEHDSSYKSDTTPRYQTRHIAMKRCKQHHALLIMGSATPSMEAWSYKDNNAMLFLTLPARVSGGTLPFIQLVSLTHSVGCLSGVLINEIKSTLAAKKQVLLLANRRGFSQVFLCARCGKTVECPHCSVNLVYHKDIDTQHKLQCHHCGFHSELPETCPSCNYVEMTMRGWGIQRVEQEVRKLFPHNSIERIDSDVIKKEKEEGYKVLEQFYNNNIQILIATQILAKGINFPSLQMVGIICADTLLGIPDFRAEERAFSLMVQVAGRAGRFSNDGKVIVQGYGLDNRVFNALQTGNTQDFYSSELTRRKTYKLSPIKRLLRIVFRGTKQAQVKAIAELFSNTLQAYINSSATISKQCTILGPSECALSRIATNYRYNLIIRANTQTILIVLCKDILASGVKKSAQSKKVYIEIDPDPINFF